MSYFDSNNDCLKCYEEIKKMKEYIKELEKENDIYKNIIKESLKQLTEEDYAKIQEEENNVKEYLKELKK